MKDQETLEQRIAELELALAIEHAKQQLLTNFYNCGIWEYDIKNKRLIQSRKLDGRWQDRHMVVDNYRETSLNWGRIHPHDIDIFEAYCDSMDAGEKVFSYEMRIISDDSRFIWVRYDGTTLFDKNGNPAYVVGTTLDITKEKTEKRQKAIQSIQSSQSTLYDKDTSVHLIRQMVEEPDSSAKNGILMLINFGDFKRINDTWGIDYGDSVLEAASRILYTNFASTDIVGKTGGVDFIAYCPNVVREEDASSIANRLMFRIRNFLELKDASSISVSIGIAFFPRHAMDYDTLYRCADYALTEAKQLGKNHFVTYHSQLVERPTGGERASSSQEGLSNIEKDLFDYSFEVLSQTPDFLDAIGKIFAEAGLFFGLDRIFLAEYRPLRQQIEITAYWETQESEKDFKYIEESCNRNWTAEERYYAHTDYCVVTGGVSEIHNLQGIKENMDHFPDQLIQFPIMDGSRLAGTISFESWGNEGTQLSAKIATLSSITKMISSYVLRLRSKDELETEILYTGKAMDVQQLAYYAIDASNYDLTFISRYAGEIFPNIRLGEKCYQTIRNLSSPCPDCPIGNLSGACRQCSAEIYRDESDSWHTVTASRLPESGQYGTNVPQFLVCWTDVTAFLDRVKSTDQLTGALSYDKFRAEALRRIMAKKTNYSLVFMGLKDFSHINDKYGYAIGDKILKSFAEILQNALTGAELLCRIKGDDFVLLLETDLQLPTADRIALLSQPLQALMREKFPKIELPCFSGIYDIQPDDYSISTVLDKAANARNVAVSNYYKYHGIYTYNEEYARQAQQEAEMERNMLEAMHSGNYLVYFQPKVDLNTGKIAGAEALVRLMDTNGNIISPARFIPLAEKNGFVLEIDKIVFEKTMYLIQKWTNDGKKVPVISVNLSRLHLLCDDLLPYMEGLLSRYELDPSQLELEITESLFFDDADRMIDMIQQLKDIGYQISMDDFGSGFSTLSLMKSLPLDVLKIDGSFFLHNELDEKNKAVISSIIHLAKNLNFRIISEGIETSEQASFAREQGSDCAQGYYFYKPMPPEEFEALLEDA